LSTVGSPRTLALLASFLFAGAAGCSGTGDGSIAVQLVYPSPPGDAGAARAPVAGRFGGYSLPFLMK